MRKAFFLTVLGLLIISGIGLQAFAFAETIPVSVSILPQAYFVERVAGGRAALRVMIPKGASPETYEPTPQQLVALSDSELYVKVGAPGLPFEEKYLRTLSAGDRKMTVVNMSEGVAFRKEDPHVWVSPAAVRIAAGNICPALTLHDPSGRDEYRRNLTVFLKDIDALEDEIRRALAGKKGYSFMAYHPAWGYFADEYGLRQLAVEEEGKPVSAAPLRQR